MKKQRLRVGLLLDTYDLPGWQEEMFRQIAHSDYAEIVLVVLNQLAGPKPRQPLPVRMWKNLGSIPTIAVRKALGFVYDRFIEQDIRMRDATAVVNVEPMLRDVATIAVTPDRKRFSDYFRARDVQAIEAHQPDILVRSGFGILRGEILDAARYGVWSFHHGDNHVNRGGPPGFWESMEGWPVTGSILQILTEDLDNGRVLYRSSSRTEPFSVRDNRSNYYWKSLAFMTRSMEELHRVGEGAFFAKVERDNRHPSFYSERLYRDPTTWELARLTARKLFAKFARILEGAFFFDQWMLLFHFRPELSSSFWRYKRIVPPKDRFWADPHVVARDDRYYIFLEEYPFREQKGHISVMTMRADGTHDEPSVVLERPYHLSYPFVFEDGDQHYMIPETMQNSTIELYRCVRFPDEWEFVQCLMEGVRALDTTLLRRDGKWWLFTNLIPVPGCSPDDELFLFSSDDLLSKDWQPHPMNPIVSDCTRARPAGKLFTYGGRLYRPSQNCGTRYGYGFNFSEVTTLTESEYSETLVSRVEPNWDNTIVGTHTFSRAGDLHVIDAQTRRRRL